MDIAKLIKLLELSSSNHDGEALNAIRKANEHREKSKKTWGQLFNYPPPPQKPAPNYYAEHPSVQSMFERLRNVQMSENTREFLRSLENQFWDRGNLTEKQRLALVKIYKSRF